MSEEYVTKKSELLAHFERAWHALATALDQRSSTMMTTIRDPEGWTVKDHLVHLYYWERSALYFLQGRPRHEGLGVTEAVYMSDDVDLINDAILTQQRLIGLDEALARLRDLNAQLLTALAPLTDEDLQKPYRHYLPDEPGEGSGPPAINVIYGNSAHHFAEHLAAIEQLCRG